MEETNKIADSQLKMELTKIFNEIFTESNFFNSLATELTKELQKVIAEKMTTTIISVNETKDTINAEYKNDIHINSSIQPAHHDAEDGPTHSTNLLNPDILQNRLIS